MAVPHLSVLNRQYLLETIYIAGKGLFNLQRYQFFNNVKIILPLNRHHITMNLNP